MRLPVGKPEAWAKTRARIPAPLLLSAAQLLTIRCFLPPLHSAHVYKSLLGHPKSKAARAANAALLSRPSTTDTERMRVQSRLEKLEIRSGKCILFGNVLEI